jgi:hypothetical protein
MNATFLRRVLVALSLCLVSLPAWAADSTLPITRVVLFKHGVAYFERQGKLDGAGDVTLEFKASEMSDVLKSLTLFGAGAVEGVSYEASDPLTKQLAEFSFSLPPDASLGQVLDQFKGARLVARLVSGGELAGTILGVHRAEVEKTETETVSLLLAGGELRSFSLREVTSLRLDDPRLQPQLESYLKLLASSHRRDVRLLRIHPGGARQLALGYLVEAPVWKTSYRLVLDPAKPREALLQGWAIVDNTSAEDWKGVTLSFVSGLPVSFTQNLYQAHYVNRPNVPLPSEMAAAPVAHEGAVVGGVAEDVAAPKAALAAPRAMAQMMSVDRLVGTAGGVAPGSGGGMGGGVFRPSDVLANVQTSTQELGELFEYRIDRPVDVPRNQSAMIPFVQTAVKVERVLFYTPGTAAGHPYDAVLLENTSGKTLDGGAITVIIGGEYAGEALVETMKPGDSRPVTFAVDLGTRITTAFDTSATQVFSVKIRRGTVFTQAKNVATTTYTIRNTGAAARTLMIEHPVRGGWKLTGDAKPVETTAQHYRFRVDALAKETARLEVKEEYETSSSLLVTNLTPDLVAEYVRNKALSPAAEKQLQQIFALKEQIAQAQSEANDRQQEINDLFRDQDRLRQNIANLRGLPGQQDQVNAYAAKLNAQEKDLESKNAALAAARARQRQLQQQLDRLVNTLALE